MLVLFRASLTVKPGEQLLSPLVQNTFTFLEPRGPATFFLLGSLHAIHHYANRHPFFNPAPFFIKVFSVVTK